MVLLLSLGRLPPGEDLNPRSRKKLRGEDQV